MDNYVQAATWWGNEKARDFTKLECGLLGALFSAIGVGLIVAVKLVLG